MAKTACPFSRSEFIEKAQPVEISVGETKMIAEPKHFSSGSFGWYVSGKATLTVEGKPVQVQVGANLVVVGSKEARE